ncbi:hypothetical protein [Namhaeicola litoreus]|uniref:Uncharacterized protein n=1 Tax=Namhaeicola litoreus TaxID=1052145 RepID=A0ABW3Y0T0_9FLAO
MKTDHTLIQEIFRLTQSIENEYPELYVYLGETPVKSTESGDKLFNRDELVKYLETLKSLLERFKATHSHG